MNIRNATYKDAPALKLLLAELGVSSSLSLLIDQLETMFSDDHNQVFVYEQYKEILGFISIHFLPQLALKGGFMLITYLSADETVGGHRIAKALEEYVAEQAMQRKCETIHVHSLDWHTLTRQFYAQQGYQEYPQYFTKRLVYGK